MLEVLEDGENNIRLRTLTSPLGLKRLPVYRLPSTVDGLPPTARPGAQRATTLYRSVDHGHIVCVVVFLLSILSID